MTTARNVSRARRILSAAPGRHIVEAYCDAPIVRLRYRLGELSIHDTEVETFAPWLATLDTGQHDGSELPVPEYWRAPWRPDYRWTARAWAAHQEYALARAIDDAQWWLRIGRRTRDIAASEAADRWAVRAADVLAALPPTPGASQ
jgi:hypothetical protein